MQDQTGQEASAIAPQPRALRWGVGGLAVVVVFPIVAWFLLPHGATPPEWRWERDCKINLKTIATGCYLYAEKNDDMFPFSKDGSLASLSLLYDECVVSPKVFTCPATKADASTLTAGAVLKEHMCSYVYLPGQLQVPVGDSAPDDLILAYDKAPVHGKPRSQKDGGRRVVVFCDTHIEVMKEDAFQKQLAADKERYAKLAPQTPKP